MKDLSFIIDTINGPLPPSSRKRTLFVFAETAKGNLALKALATALNLDHGFGHGSEALGTYKPFCYVVLKEE